MFLAVAIAGVAAIAMPDGMGLAARMRRLAMTIEPLMSRRVRQCRPDHALDHAASLMWEHDCGCLPVCVEGASGAPRVIGMLTDRDICMAACFQGKPLGELKVADAMSRGIRTCALDDRPEDVEVLMREQRIRRVPVTDFYIKSVGGCPETDRNGVHLVPAPNCDPLPCTLLDGCRLSCESLG
jgi:CBS domain-containing protein